MPSSMRVAGVIRLSRFDMTCIDQAISYIEKNYRDYLSAEQLSIEVGLNIKKLRSGFKKKTGYNFHEYHQKIRVEKAKEFLISTPHPLKYIASQVGFKNESHFCQKFRRLASITPNEFRFLIDENPTEKEKPIPHVNAVSTLRQKRAS